jgi:D-alanyl-lipoteichoic acid acyltransferase DltB (MBOAT superfamily)
VVFNSFPFLVFLAVLLSLYYRFGHRAQNRLLLVASYVFYGWWDWRFLSLLWASSIFDWWAGLKITEAEGRQRRAWLWGSIIINLGVLGLFKYSGFFIDSFVRVLAVIGIQADFPTLHVLLPLGISFYTFLSMSYTIDVYRGEMRATRTLEDFMLYVAFFPHLVAGPIVRASFLLPQCAQPRVIKRTQVLDGIWLFLLGMVKKLVIADRLGQVADWGFTAGMKAPFADANAWLPIYAFAFQIYGDFSGYSDMARGLSKIMGFELTENFRAPYLVSGPAEFWRHWHISLSTWLRDYVYIPMGGNRLGGVKTYRNLMITMLLGGLWHGAGFAFVLWGAFHGALLALGRWLAGGKSKQSAAPPRAWLRCLAVAAFFHLTCIGWLLFRAGAMPKLEMQRDIIGEYLSAMFSFRFIDGLSALLWPVALLGALALWMQWKHQEMDHFSDWPETRQVVAIAAALTLIASLGVFHGNSFIYFQF